MKNKYELYTNDIYIVKGTNIKGNLIDYHYDKKLKKGIYVLKELEMDSDGEFKSHDVFEEELEFLDNNKFNLFGEVFIKETSEKGTIVDLYKTNDIWYYQVELNNKTPDRDVLECSEEQLELV